MAPPALELRDVGKRFGRTEIIRDVSLQIGRGERHAIIGPSRAGKSTLFNLIGGRFESPGAGQHAARMGRDITEPQAV